MGAAVHELHTFQAAQIAAAGTHASTTTSRPCNGSPPLTTRCARILNRPATGRRWSADAGGTPIPVVPLGKHARPARCTATRSWSKRTSTHHRTTSARASGSQHEIQALSSLHRMELLPDRGTVEGMDMEDQSMSTQPQSLNERCFDATMRVEHIVHLPVMVAEAADSDLIDFLEERCAALLAPLLGVDLADALSEYGTKAWERSEGICELFAWKHVEGWIVEASHPIMRKTKAGMAFSWGQYESHCFYGETYEAALDRAFAWVSESDAKVRSSEVVND